MNDRVNQYYHLPAPKALVEHFRNEIGLTPDYQAIFDDLRKTLGDTQFHADNLKLPLRKYGDKAAILGQKCVWELVRLATIGYEAERRENGNE